jgi:hypothetical protein
VLCGELTKSLEPFVESLAHAKSCEGLAAIPGGQAALMLNIAMSFVKAAEQGSPSMRVVDVAPRTALCMRKPSQTVTNFAG